MKDYKRLTEIRYGLIIDNCANCPNISNPQGCTARKCNEIKKNRLADLEDKIERGEIDYVAEKDAKIARLTAENASLRARLEKAVKIGDTVYQTDTDGARIYKSTVKRIIFDTGDFAFDETAIGTSVFLSEEALIKKQSKEKTEK